MQICIARSLSRSDKILILPEVTSLFVVSPTWYTRSHQPQPHVGTNPSLVHVKGKSRGRLDGQHLEHESRELQSQVMKEVESSPPEIFPSWYPKYKLGFYSPPCHIARLSMKDP